MNLMPKLHFLIQGASGFRGTAFAVNVSNTALSTHGIMLGGLMNGKLKDGLRKIAALLNTSGVFMKANELQSLCY